MTDLPRRDLLLGALACGAALVLPPSAARAEVVAAHPRQRVICDNDFNGDPDGLFQLAHHLLCPSVTIPLIVGTHLRPNEPWDPSPTPATDAADRVRELLAVMGMTSQPVLAGAEHNIASRAGWKPSPATAAIVREAMRSDSKLPLYYCAGANLTELALAWLAEPRIGPRLKLIWIGGSEHPGLARPPVGTNEPEYNFTQDPIAAQIIFNESDIEIWQVPRDAYRQMMFSFAELDELVRTGPLGRYLKGRLDIIAAAIAKEVPLGETYVLGDSPLVTLTALQPPFQPDTPSSRYEILPTPGLTAKGDYEPRPQGRPMRVYTSIDAGLTFRDMVAKFRAAGSALM